MVDRLPILYVRGFAGGQSGIDDQTEDPFYGFNLGSTHVRIGDRGKPNYYQFESPLLRLMLDHEYDLVVKGGQEAWLRHQPDGEVNPATIWIHRFYDVSASTWGGEPQEFALERAAASLWHFVELVRRKTGAPRVHLVAHSMGGLICRCLIQKVIPDLQRASSVATQASDYIDRFFTYATPHGGIEFEMGRGLFERIRDTFGIAGADIFGPTRMWEYLNPADPGPRPDDWDPRTIPESAFPNDRIFTLIGTNPQDYTAAHGLSSKVVGVKSDGLVQIDNAYVPGAKFAFIHRSHSGRYGIVNSEEGYQNLRRFLFGDLEVQADLVGLELPGDDDDEVVWQAEVELSVRGLPTLMHQQVAMHHCPVILERPRDAADRPHPLITTFLLAGAGTRPEGSDQARYTLHIRVLSLRQRSGLFDFGDHLEQAADFDDILIVDIGAAGGRPIAWSAWNSQLAQALRDYEPQGPPLQDENPAPRIWVATVPLPEVARHFLGNHASIRLTVKDRTGAGHTGLQG